MIQNFVMDEFIYFTSNPGKPEQQKYCNNVNKEKGCSFLLSARLNAWSPNYCGVHGLHSLYCLQLSFGDPKHGYIHRRENNEDG